MNLLSLWLLFSLISFAHASTGPAPSLEIVTHVSRSKAIEQYEYNPYEYNVDPRTAKKHLSYVALFNDRGQRVESWDIINEPDASHYSRHVFTYDLSDRMTAELTYESAKAPPNQLFSVSRFANGVKIVPQVEDNISEIVINEYDRNGNLVEMRWTDGDGNLKQKATYEFDNKGKEIKSRNEKGDGRVDSESTSVHSENGRLVEETFQKNNTSGLRKLITRRDDKGRDVLEEQFSLREGDQGSDKKPSLVLTSRSVCTYSGELENDEWTIWNNRGELEKKLLLVSKGDYAISSKEFVPGSAESDAKQPLWVLTGEEIHDYEYNKNGDIIKIAVRQRPAPDKPFRFIDMTESVITYF